MTNNANKKKVDKILKIFFSIYSIVLLFFILFCTSPILKGDGHEYLGMTISFFNHLTPDLKKEDIELRKIVDYKNNINFPDNETYQGYFQSLDGKLYSYHFWVYSLSNLPIFYTLHYFDLNELRSFQITNALLLILSLWIIIYFFPMESDRQKIWFLLFSAFNPALLYVRWTHPEIFSYSFVIIAIVFALRKNYKVAILMSSIASLQNPPIVMMTIWLIIYGWKEEKWDIKELTYLLICSSISILSYLFYYWNYHVLNLISVKGGASIENISLNSVMSFFFDLNYGMLPYIPLLLIFSIITIITSIKKKDIFVPSLWVVLIIMAVLSSTTYNMNHGMTYINRYIIWMIPLIILIVVQNYTYYSAKKLNVLLLIIFMTTASVTAILLYNYDDSSYVKFNNLSNTILINFPSMYNPIPEIFAERSIRAEIRGEIDYSNLLPIVYLYNNKPRKILYKDSKELDDLRYVFNFSISDNIVHTNNGLSYVNYPSMFDIPDFNKVETLYRQKSTDIIQSATVEKHFIRRSIDRTYNIFVKEDR